MTGSTQSCYLTGRYVEAFGWALKVHDGQARHNSGTPYMSHLISTSALVLESGGDEDVAIAALLHDVVEDQNVSICEVASRFGGRVARIVADCTDVRPGVNRHHVDWRRRKVDHVERMRDYGADSLLVIGADKVASLQALIDDIAVHGVELFQWSQRSAEELYWNYSLILNVLDEKSIPIALTARLNHLLSHLRQVTDF
jgi:(p)ppGpp synthase/HD superfamily hydrolase